MFPCARHAHEDTVMAITAVAALRRLCELKQWSVSNLEANKLLYFAQMIALGKSEGRQPLVVGHFEAWDLGPVLPDAYHKAKIFGNKPIKSFVFSGSGPIPEWDAIIEETLKEMGDLTSSQLVAESHWRDGAWAKFYRPGAKGIEIPNTAILDEYRLRAN